MGETLLIYGFVAGFVVVLFAVLRWLGPILDRWADRQDQAEAERRRPTTPRPPYPPPSQHDTQTREYRRARDSAALFVSIGLSLRGNRTETDIEDEP